MKHIIFTCTFLLAIITGLISQENLHQHHKLSPEFRKEMTTYVKTNVFPVIQKEHDEFEASLNEADQEQLAEIRQDIRTTMEEAKTFFEKVIKEAKAGADKTELKEKYMPIVMQKMMAKMVIVQKIKPFMENNANLIDESIAQIEPKEEGWHNDMETIRKKYISDEELKEAIEQKKEAMEERKADFELPPMFKNFQKNPKMLETLLGGNLKEVAFVLWDGDLLKAMEQETFFLPQEINELQLNLTSNNRLGQNFPNPASGLTTIEFYLERESQDIQLIVVDASGKTIENINFDKLESGQHQVELNTTSWSPGNYIYTLQALMKIDVKFKHHSFKQRLT